MPVVYISVGSNLGNRYKNIKKALTKIKNVAKIIKISSIYLTSPTENFNQPNFYNCVIKINTKLKPSELLTKLKEIEKMLGRNFYTKRYQPRIIDLDILFYGKKIIKKKNLVIPHKKLHKRKFVLWPLNEIASNFVHPVFKKKIFNIKKMLEFNKGQKIKLLIPAYKVKF
ncbi:MAG: 2-amino-4-hydroxy-6-hydroxymethyldihydropteridine diphosphokinase [Endomicrobiia bacterium]